MKTAISLVCTLVIVSFSNALPVETELSVANLGTVQESETTAITLLDVDQSAASDSGDDLKRTVRGLGLGGFGKGFGGGFGGLGGKFGGLGGHGLGGFGHGLGGFGHGLGGFGHGLGGFGGGFKKPFSFKGF